MLAYSFPQHNSERLNQRTLVLEVADYCHNFPKIIGTVLRQPISKDTFLRFVLELEEYYELFVDWSSEETTNNLERELVQTVLNNQKELAEKLNV